MTRPKPAADQRPSLKAMFPALKERPVRDLLAPKDFFERFPQLKPGDIVDVKGNGTAYGIPIRADGRYRLKVDE